MSSCSWPRKYTQHRSRRCPVQRMRACVDERSAHCLPVRCKTPQRPPQPCVVAAQPSAVSAARLAHSQTSGCCAFLLPSPLRAAVLLPSAAQAATVQPLGAQRRPPAPCRVRHRVFAARGPLAPSCAACSPVVAATPLLRRRSPRPTMTRRRRGSRRPTPSCAPLLSTSCASTALTPPQTRPTTSAVMRDCNASRSTATALTPTKLRWRPRSRSPCATIRRLGCALHAARVACWHSPPVALTRRG